MIQRLLCTLILLAGLLVSGTASASTIDLSKALVIGNGPKKVIEFTDPDCPFCRKASAYFHNRRDITRYVFFNPLAMHPHARPKVQYILSSPDKAQLYHDVMSGMVDRMDAKNLPVSAAGVKLQEEQQAIAKKAGVDSTPTFMIMGRIIEGFDLPKIEELLGKP
ncbi:MAG: thioredoxin fold domain-containing protein [Trichlorobacter sp.]|uniref:thioredoxin fold domain-containing protein n=1 Tax=Trichlorobacter sp. TaxID=2911007 RepID=UPI00256BAF35|nr:thioredoxin fold domain-containing protein [Trichlorobacter sp.]MDK9717500.1 thioredoxin fold domain-containing protein [Trichlorobacter sp.]